MNETEQVKNKQNETEEVKNSDTEKMKKQQRVSSSKK